MIKFLKDSVRELKHVVWPTREETKNYFITVMVVLILFGLFLFIASTIFTKALFGLKDMVSDNGSIENTINTETNNPINIKTISAEADVEEKNIEVVVNTWSVETTSTGTSE